MRRRTSFWWLAGAAAGLAALLFIPWFVVDARLAARLAAHEADLAAREARGFDRPPILLPGTDGDAVEAYRRAMLRLAQLSADGRSLLRYLPCAVPPLRLGEDPRLGELDGSAEAVVEAVRDALRCSRFRFDLDYRPGLSGWKDRKISDLGAVLVLHLEQALAVGREEEALRTCLDFLAFEGDLLRGFDSYWAAHQAEAHTLAALLLDATLASHSLPAAALRESLRTLDHIETLYPSPQEAGRIHFLLCRTSVFIGDPGSISAPDPGWRHLGSRRLLDLTLLAALDEEESSYLRVFEGPPAGLVERARLHDKAVEQRKHLELWRNWHSAGWYAQAQLRRRAVFDLVRTALVIALYEAETGSRPERLEDLVPGRLPAIPVCGLTGRPLGYAPGKIWYAWDNDDLVIRLRRR